MTSRFCFDGFWNGTLFLNANHPIFTECFQYSLLFIPSGIFSIFFLVFLCFKLYRSQQIIKIPFDFWHILKMSFQLLLVVLLIVEILLDGWIWKNSSDMDGLFILSYIFLCITLILVMVQTEIRRRTMHPVCQILFIFWFTGTLTYALRFYSNVLRITGAPMNTSSIIFLCLSGAALFLFAISFIFDCFSRYSRDRIVIKKTEPCPEEYASILSKLTYCWLDKYIYKWYKNEMADETAFDLREEDESTKNTNLVERVFLDKIAKVKRSGSVEFDHDTTSSTANLITTEDDVAFPQKQNPGRILFYSLMKIYSSQIFLAWLFKFINDVLIYAMPFLLKILLQYIQDKNNTVWIGYCLAITFLIAGVVGKMFENLSFFITQCVSVKMRAAIIGMIYRKTLRLSNEVQGKFTSGEIVNLMSVDSERIMLWIGMSWFVVSCPVQILIGVLLLYQEMNYAIFAGFGLIVAFFPVNGIIMMFMQRYSTLELTAKDKRIKIITEILNGIKVLKMYAWEKSFLAKVTNLRKTEIKSILRVSASYGAVSSLWEVLPFLIMLATFLTYVFMDESNVITPERAFVSLTLFNLMRFPMIILPWGLTETINSFVSMKRIGEYLVGEELDSNGTYHLNNSTEQQLEGDSVIEIRDGSFSWKKEDKIILKKIDLDIHRGKLVAVVGKVGTGKSSLMSAILGEMHRMNGSVKIQGKMAYVSQEAWIQNKSLKDNILFTQKYDETFYNKVIEACSLKPDLEQLPAGDATEIGERGINLSGGQKQRVSLARAVYQNGDIYLLDDPLSAVDAHVGQHLFDNVISNNGILQGKTRILVTHGLNWLPKVDEVFVLDSNGSISERGSFKDLLKNGDNFMQFIQDYIDHNKRYANSNQTNDNLDEDIVKAKNLLTQVSESEDAVDEFTNFVTNTSPKLHFKRQMSVESKSSDQRINTECRISDSRISGERKISNLEISRERKTSEQVISSSSRRRSSDMLPKSMKYLESSVSDFYSDQETQSKFQKSGSIGALEKSTVSRPIGQLIDEEEAMQGTVHISTYIMYMKARGLLILIPTIAIYIMYSGLSIFNNIWLQRFTDDALIKNASSQIQANKSYIPAMSNVIRTQAVYYMEIYTLIGVGMFFSIILYWIGFTIGSVRAAKVIHKKLLYTILRCSMHFFDTTPSGRILNRFSKDMDLVDHMIPMNISDAFNCFLMVFGSIIVIIYVTPWFALVIIPIGILYYFIQLFYMPSSRQSRRLDSIASSPIFNNFTETLQGVAVIRAFGEENYFQKLNQSLIDRSSKFKFIQFAATRWLSLRIDTIGSFMVFMAVLFAIIARDSISASMVGLSISYSLQITEVLNWLLRQYTDLETNSVSLERIREYSMIPSEAEWDVDNDLPNSWPSVGNVDFINYDLRYRKDLPLVLKDINLHLNGGEKIGIVGRTGAGKSSLNLALFRLVEPAGGAINIDNVDISTLGLHDLRKNLTILPQDPVIFSGTLRENLDPFEKHTEAELFETLETAHLKEWVSLLSEGIDYECGEGGANLSAGQKQLLCLARALLRKSKVLILDEATASVDVETDRLVMQTIRDNFRSSTVIIIAHRINTILDSDKIVVMDNGCIVEMDSPQNLLATPGSLFKSLAEQSSNNEL